MTKYLNYARQSLSEAICFALKYGEGIQKNLITMDIVSKEQRSWNMSRIRSTGTQPEIRVRSVLHQLGYRFRINRKDLPGSPDIVLPKHKTIILVHGCYWHRHPECPKATVPKTRPDFWNEKFSQNVQRDKKVVEELEKLGWNVIVIWECETRNIDKLKELILRQFNKLSESDYMPRRAMKVEPKIDVINMFSGAGGLAEGFCPVGKSTPYRIKLTIEKNQAAFKSIRLRNFLRQFSLSGPPDEYYRFLKGEMTEKELFDSYPDEADTAEEVSCLTEIGNEPAKKEEDFRHHICNALVDGMPFVLIGGPPCQAYSSVGRSRNSSKEDYTPEKDPRYSLYREYVKVLAEFHPSAFVFENVLGLLSARKGDVRIFPEILCSLVNPCSLFKNSGQNYEQVKYRLYALHSGEADENADPRVFLVKSEELGLPQTRHRLIIIGIRDDLGASLSPVKRIESEYTGSGQVLNDLPKLRSGISRGKDDPVVWRQVLLKAPGSEWLKAVAKDHGTELLEVIKKASKNASLSSWGRGGQFVSSENLKTSWEPEWFCDERLDGINNHHSKEHMETDLHRYLFVASFSEVFRRSPRMHEFPKKLLPEHGNALSGKFPDRFRAQHPGLPTKTITSHLAKDGHYFIHPDPAQCRSFTVREAARIQTFPDNYYFFGNKTEQYTQVGNAVPPLLAKIIADNLLKAMS